MLGIVTGSQGYSAVNPMPSAEQMYTALSLCALNVNLKVDADIKGSLKSLFEDASAKGRFSVETTTAFLGLFPDTDKLKAYRAYRGCMFKTLNLTSDSICADSPASHYTRIAMSRFILGPGVNQEDLYSTSLASLLKASRKYRLVLSEQVQQTLEQLSDSDPLMSLAMANDTTECANQVDQAFLPSVSVLGDKVVIAIKIVDVRTTQVLRIIRVQGSDRTIDSFDQLMLFTWRKIEDGLAPESWIWRNGIGYCDRLKYIISEVGTSSCKEGTDDRFSLMEDGRTGNSFIDNCQQTWRRNQMEPVCMFQCVGGRPTDVSLYKRLDGNSVIEQPRSSSEQRAFVETLMRKYGFSEEELAKFNIKSIYPDQELKDPETIFTSAIRDIQACLPAWKNGIVASGADQKNDSKNIMFYNEDKRLILKLSAFSSDNTRWNFVTLTFQ
ncbi:hypothetical protein [Mesorhizobium sp. M0586]|uniref:hypothetical protein n=1 Tax=unclassified Mesorhizobium TaxID=325217 RepID=UPI00333BB0AC